MRGLETEAKADSFGSGFGVWGLGFRVGGGGWVLEFKFIWFWSDRLGISLAWGLGFKQLGVKSFEGLGDSGDCKSLFVL